MPVHYIVVHRPKDDPTQDAGNTVTVTRTGFQLLLNSRDGVQYRPARRQVPVPADTVMIRHLGPAIFLSIVATAYANELHLNREAGNCNATVTIL